MVPGASRPEHMCRTCLVGTLAEELPSLTVTVWIGPFASVLLKCASNIAPCPVLNVRNSLGLVDAVDACLEVVAEAAQARDVPGEVVTELTPSLVQWSAVCRRRRQSANAVSGTISSRSRRARRHVVAAVRRTGRRTRFQPRYPVSTQL